MKRHRAAVFLLAGVLLSLPVAAAVSTLKFRIAAEPDEMASITCVEATGGACTVATGMQEDPHPAMHRIAIGGTIELKNPGGRLHYCVTVKEQLEWPSCLSGTNTGPLNIPRTVNKILWD
ncbi:hypothetical protein GCM10027277_11170 [Pseudoduganella ginsengisoli]|uniref:Uncharacterized protein n=1 Tax=Pseudoduganella ginsengisoli TaxID=1462440 RepID=A0A6L6PVE2_9BURK|nr:hypothetical protein [Pseudoduganella ginsengisoli]MTW01513.1 hypothetical protein [Pseudoduganella ginsengisoli]